MSTRSNSFPEAGQPLSNEPVTPSEDPKVLLANRLKAADDAYNAADEARRKAFAIAFDSGAMTLKEIAEAVGRTDHGIRTLIADHSDRSTGKTRAAADALEQLGG